MHLKFLKMADKPAAPEIPKRMKLALKHKTQHYNYNL